MKAGLGALAALTLVAPVLAFIALIGVAGTAVACLTTPTPVLSSSAPVPREARLWVAAAQGTCPQLPPPWIAAVMAADSQFDPTASNSAGRGLISVADNEWVELYGARWDADLDANGIADASEPLTSVDVAGRSLCLLLEELGTYVTSAVGTEPLAPLDALALAHRAGLTAVQAWPHVGAADLEYVARVHRDAVAWSDMSSATLGGSAGSLVNDACAASLGGVGAVVVPPGTATNVADAVTRALALVGARSGWFNRCDRLACRAYGYANSGYPSATAHWAQMVISGHAHIGDRCPPVGSFAYWATGGPNGHVALVVASDRGCDPARIKLVTNDALDRQTGFSGGVYLVSLAQIESGFMNSTGYRGWSEPVCAGNVGDSASS